GPHRTRREVRWWGPGPMILMRQETGLSPDRTDRSPVVGITIEVDPDRLYSYTDRQLAMCWPVVQANPAPHGDQAAGELAEKVGFEIIARWLRSTDPELYRHQGRHYFWAQLRRFAARMDGEWIAKVPTEEVRDTATSRTSASAFCENV